jgi:tRNA-2-methylthio-N6-dimethylallyladenosine synthase
VKYSIVTYGCQMNEADSELVAEVLDRAGWEQAISREEADLLVLNTCSVREKPEQKVRSLLGELRRWKRAQSDRVIAVMGCMAQREGNHILEHAPHVDLVVGTRWFHRMDELVQRARSGEAPMVRLDMDEDPSAARCPEATKTSPAALRAFVPIVRGCSDFCSYCIVPSVRGAETSRPAEAVADEVRDSVLRGTREVTLLGQNVLSYGKDLAEQPTFSDLLRLLADIPELWRIRFTTCHPRDVNGALVSAMADVKAVCEHIHLPVQAGADRLLQDMNRGYTTRQYLGVVEELRSHVPGIAITTDIMVGFPGETEEEFERSLDFYRHIGFDSAFTFAYSPRPGTAAARRHDEIPREIRLARLQRLIAVQNEITTNRNRAAIGEETEVLVDGPAPRGEGLLAGRTRTNKQVIFPGEADLRGRLAQVHLSDAHLWGFRGRVVGG